MCIPEAEQKFSIHEGVKIGRAFPGVASPGTKIDPAAAVGCKIGGFIRNRLIIFFIVPPGPSVPLAGNFPFLGIIILCLLHGITQRPSIVRRRCCAGRYK